MLNIFFLDFIVPVHQTIYIFNRYGENKFKFSSTRIYLRGQNLFTYVKDKRFNTDPEVSIDGTMSQRPPVFNTFLFGLDINF